jgi:gliding motility-associated-like protein
VLCNGGSTGAASITVTGGTGTYTYNWSAGPNNLPAGSYTVTATDAGSCTVTQVFVITEPSPINAITSSISAPCVGQSNGAIAIEINGGTPNYQVVWNPTGNVSNSGNNSTINDIAAGQYVATITDANTCSYQYPVQLVAADGLGCNLFIPELTSPNGDGKNDTWEIKGLENYPNNNVTVFNRWGDQVFKAEPYKNDWDGTNTGDKSLLGKGALPVGTYYFILDLGNGDKPITGYVQLTK